MKPIIKPISEWLYAKCDLVAKRIADNCYQPAGSAYLLHETIATDTDVQGNPNKGSIIFEIQKESPETLKIYRQSDNPRDPNPRLLLGELDSKSVIGEYVQDNKNRMCFRVVELGFKSKPVVIYSQSVTTDISQANERLKVSDKIFNIIRRSREISYGNTHPTLAEISGKIVRRYASQVTKAVLREMDIKPHRLPKNGTVRRLLRKLEG
jgi:hypothetical protein